MTHAMKETSLAEEHEYSQKDIAEKLFLAVGTVASTEKRAIERFKEEMAKRGIDVKDLLKD